MQRAGRVVAIVEVVVAVVVVVVVVAQTIVRRQQERQSYFRAPGLLRDFILPCPKPHRKEVPGIIFGGSAIVFCLPSSPPKN